MMQMGTLDRLFSCNVFQELPAVIRMLLRTVLLQFGSGEHCKNARLANRNQVSLQ